jgi:parallel beta-helix repeat protein
MYKRLFIYFFVAIVAFAAAPLTANAKTNFKPESPLTNPTGELKKIGGAHFELSGSPYLNLTIDSSKNVDLQVTSIPEIVMMKISSQDQTKGNNTKLDISGFLPNTTYYKYEDDFRNLTKFTTSSSGTYSYNQNIKTSHLVFIKARPSTYHITISNDGGGCYLIGTWSANTYTCTLSTNVTQEIEIDDNGVTLDGDQHTVSSPNDIGIYASGMLGVTIKNITINNSAFGVILYNNVGSAVDHVSVSGAAYGILISGGNGNTVTYNIANSNTYYGIFLGGNDNYVGHNTANNNGYNGINLDYSWYSGSSAPNHEIAYNTLQENHQTDFGISVSDTNSNAPACTNNVHDNTGSGDNPIGYYHSAVTLASGTFAELILCHANNSNISNVTITGSTARKNNMILSLWTSSSTLTNITSSNNSSGFILQRSSGNTFDGITSSHNAGVGMYFISSDDNTIEGGVFDTNDNAIQFSGSSGGTIRNTTIENNSSFGVYVTGNDNQIYNNNFINNPHHVILGASTGNIFNESAPIGGNYWSDYADHNSQSPQGCVDGNSDGFCDYAYSYTAYGQTVTDNLPLVTQASPASTFWADIENTPSLTLRSAPYVDSSTEVKILPAAWVIRVTSVVNDYTYTEGHNSGGYPWYQVTDLTDNVSGWMAAGDSSGTTGYLVHSGSTQNDLEAKTATYDTSSRPNLIIDAIDHYYYNTDTTSSLYSSNDGGSGAHPISTTLNDQTYPFSRKVIWGITARETGGADPRFDNENVSSDYGHGIMQLTFLPDSIYSFDNRGIASNVKIPLCSIESDLFANCYSDPSGDYNYRQYKHYGDNSNNPIYKQYVNSFQSIYANIKDGLQILANSYYSNARNIVNPVTADDNVTYSALEARTIVATEGYQGSCGYVKLVANRLYDIATYFTGENINDISTLVDQMYTAGDHEVCGQLHSPGDLSIQDSSGRTVGVVNGEGGNDFPLAVYDQTRKFVKILAAGDKNYTYKVVGWW